MKKLTKIVLGTIAVGTISFFAARAYIGHNVGPFFKQGIMPLLSLKQKESIDNIDRLYSIDELYKNEAWYRQKPAMERPASPVYSLKQRQKLEEEILDLGIY